MSVIATGLYLILKAFSIVTMKYFKASWHYYTYTAVYMFLLLPYHKHVPLLDFNQKINTELALPALSSIVRLPSSSSVDFVTVVDKTEHVPAPSLDFLPYFLMAGTLAFIIIILIQNVKLYRRIFGVCKLTDKVQYQDILAKCKQEMKMSNCVLIYISPYASTPFLYGVFKPRIVLPDIEFTEEELRYIFRHELTHWKSRDAWLKCLMILINAIHWFNPLAYIARYDIDRFCELSCDESVVGEMNYDERKRYCELILGVLWNVTGHNVKLFSAFSDKRKQLEGRMSMIMKNEGLKRKTWVSMFSVVMAMALILAGAITAYAATGDAPAKQLGGLAEETIAEGNATNMLGLADVEAQNSVGGTHTVAEVFDPNTIEPYKVDLAKEFNLAVGKSYQTTFTMDGWGDSHNAFKSKITGVSGTYKYIITSDSGYSYTSSEYSSDMSFTTTNANSGVKYTVTIVNTGSKTLSGKLNITSYIN